MGFTKYPHSKIGIYPLYILLMAFFISSCGVVRSTSDAQPFQPMTGWSNAHNAQVAKFLASTDTIHDRKVAVFDCDGTLFGQCPYYLNDEAIFSYIIDTYKDKMDEISRKKTAIFERFCREQNSLSEEAYYQYYADLLEGLTVQQAQTIGTSTFARWYSTKVFADMQTLIANLKRHHFEIWVVTGSVQQIYQQVCADVFSIPVDHVIGIRIKEDTHGVLLGEYERPLTLASGKVDAINKYIGVQPLLVAGNSTGDLEMMQYAKLLKIILNPDHSKMMDSIGCQTLKTYWSARPDCIVEHAHDVDEGHPYVCNTIGLWKNASNP